MRETVVDFDWPDFLEHHWARKPGVFQADVSLLTLGEAMLAFSRAGRIAVRNFRDVALRFYCGRDAQDIRLVSGALPRGHESDPVAYMARVHQELGDTPVAMMLNDVTLHVPGLRAKLEAFAAPLLARQQELKIKTVMFFGDYTHTPFGIHRDRLDTFLFPLLLGKTLYTWPTDAYEGPDRLRIHDIADHLPTATRRQADVSQMLYTPMGHWHCGENSGLALSFHLGFLRPDALTE